MTLQERIKAKLDPKKAAKKEVIKFVKKKLPSIKEGMEDFFDNLFLEVAEENKENPFELLLVISNNNKENKLLGTVYNKKKKNFGSIDVGELAETVVNGQMEVIPVTMKALINEGLAELNLSVSSLLSEEVGEKQLIAKYNKESELIFVEIDGKNKRKINFVQILNKLVL